MKKLFWFGIAIAMVMGCSQSTEADLPYLTDNDDDYKYVEIVVEVEPDEKIEDVVIDGITYYDGLVTVYDVVTATNVVLKEVEIVNTNIVQKEVAVFVTNLVESSIEKMVTNVTSISNLVMVSNIIYITPLEEVKPLVKDDVLRPSKDKQSFDLSIKGSTVYWYEVYMEAGKTYVIKSVGDTSAGDPTAKLWKSKKDLYALKSCNCDGGEGMNFIVTYTPTVSGIYYLKIRLYDQGEWSGQIKYYIK